MAEIPIPPILPDIKEELLDYIIRPERLPIHQYETNQEFWARIPNPTNLFFHDVSPLCTTLKVQRDPNTGEILEFVEVPVQQAGANSKNSMSFTRAPAPPSEAIRGNASNMPFIPAAFLNENVTVPEYTTEIFEEELLTVPPGFKSGMDFSKLPNASHSSEKISLKPDVVNITDLLQSEQDPLGLWKPAKSPEPTSTESDNKASSEELNEVLPESEIPIIKISEKAVPPGLKGTEWAIMLDSTKPVHNFYDKIPEMAHKFPFELDIFQKQAILQLEQHNHVFVAAHTSAGKTVVAEYAIALSQKHMTRSIYTSPIKALSNQKYRDFKQIFKDVGLITGDFQINQTAACLIMTTEILRSMLYCGSDVTRDLEYVIFDEVHYINDKERGHVWEQVLIMLPAHVCVVLLSATVPNTLEFADWLGRTHQKKVYVVSTYQRPVPLKHYLYTGSGGSTKDNRFKILDNSGWNQEGYFKAKTALAPTKSTYYKPTQEKTMWYALIDHLDRQKLLPVVVFTFSRAKCDSNAENLASLDLTNQKEKSAIHRFFEDCIKNLKEPDRNIPQIVRMRNILERGIGVHHSGILPIIKEMVEMLFQNGLLKLLFATETFAMGVNMPARTVIFDSISKHDGREKRNLHPAEYIQMAGRAGRRGKDAEGTVIILCKGFLPGAQELQDMMLGKPSQLTSQFRLTYGMVLSLLRVESLSVEGMMSRSFREADHQKNMISIRENLERVERNLEENFSAELSGYLEPLIQYYQKASSYLEYRKGAHHDLIMHKEVIKQLCPGRIVLITHAHYVNKLGMVLSQANYTNGRCKVLILTDESDKARKNDNKNELWYKMVGLSSDNVFAPISSFDHDVVTISPTDIFEICRHKSKIDTDTVFKDWSQRQIPRFASSPPGPTCNNALQELVKISQDNSVEYYDLFNDFVSNKQLTLFDEVSHMRKLKAEVVEQTAFIKIPNFEQQFETVFNKKILEDERDHLKYLLSHASMTLYPDYENRIKLLQELKYVDKQNRVELKGRVACEMGMNELIVTELVLRNVLTKLQPAEVAALLSCMVFQAKTKVDISECKLTAELDAAMGELKHIYEEIETLEEQNRIVHDNGRELNFGLVEVVYEWASAKPFAEIMNLTDVQEGIIVRCIQQLNETICDVKNAARLIGDPALQNKMEEASTAIKRDIVFAASLYTQREAATL